MSAATFTFTESVNTGSGVTINSIKTIDVPASLTVEIPVPANATAFEYDINFLKAGLKAVAIYSPAAVTIKTNSSGSPIETIPIAAGELKSWYYGQSGGIFLHDVNSLFFANPSNAIVKVQLRLGADPGVLTTTA